MYHFEGEFRRRPQQSLRGASTKAERETIIQHAQAERQKRQDQRQRIFSATIIQAFIRGTFDRIAIKREQRRLFDAQLGITGKAGVDAGTLIVLLRRLLIFYTEDADTQRLVSLCQLLLKNRAMLSGALAAEPQQGVHWMKQLLHKCCCNILHVLHSSQPIAVQLRMLEIYTSEQGYVAPSISSGTGVAEHPAMLCFLERVLQYLVDKNFFECTREVLLVKVPASLEHGTKPPTPIAATAYELTAKPVMVAAYSKNAQFRRQTFVAMCEQLFVRPLPEQISLFLLPALAARSGFPFAAVVASLLADDGLSVTPSPWLLYSLLVLGRNCLDKLSENGLLDYLLVISHLSASLQTHSDLTTRRAAADDTDSEEEEELMATDDDQPGDLRQPAIVIAACLDAINDARHVGALLDMVDRHPDASPLAALCQICHNVMGGARMQAVHRHRLLSTLAFQPTFLRQLWLSVKNMATPTITGSSVRLLQLLSRGLRPEPHDAQRIVPQVALFCALYGISLLTLHDDEFYQDTDGAERSPSMAFSLHELVSLTQTLRDVALGLLELTHPQTVHQNYLRALTSVGKQQQAGGATTVHSLHRWSDLFQMVSLLVRQLYARDTRRPFCPPGHWIAQSLLLQADRPRQLFQHYHAGTTLTSPGQQPPSITPAEAADLPALSVTEARNLAVLTELPFIVPFEHRVKIFQQLITSDKEDNHRDRDSFAIGPSINTLVRRGYLYEDAFDKLSPENEPNLKLRMRVQLVNFAGLDEAGIDGGGIFREFLSELLKTCFDPNRGFFRTTHDRQLYPNPQAPVLFDNFKRHYYFIGRMLGKALYENMLVEIPFAGFFLAKILSKHSSDVDINHLASLDPLMYKNLLYLKTCEGDVADLGLDFTVVNDELGETRIEDLVPDGRDILVTEANRIKYMHLLADYKLNKQIKQHCHCFKQGVADVIDLAWLQMFDYGELQVLISGAHVPIDVADMRRHTLYTGGYTEDHPTILMYWRVVEGFTENQKRLLLKFITSCSRPPLLGFKELFPPVSIGNAGTDIRLPSASTCMNLLKLPQYPNDDLLSTKLLYAIESGAGFELS